MDTTLWLNGQQSSQWHQQTWSQAGCSNTQYSITQFNPGYVAYYSSQTSKHQNSTSAQQLPSNLVLNLPNNFVHGNVNLQKSYKVAQTVPHQWQVSKCQITTQQHSTSNVNWSNQRPPTSTTQAATFPLQNTQYIVPVTFIYVQKSPQTTTPQNACKELNIVTKGTSQSSTQSKTRKEDAPPPPYPASKMQMPANKHSRSKEHDATFDSSSGQLPELQTHLPLQSCVGKAPAFRNSPVMGGTSQSFTPTQTKKVTREEDAPPPPYPASEMQMPAYEHSRSKEHDATFDSSSGKSQLESNSWPRLKKTFTVLDNGCVYSESPYVSPWLNVNKQLDDIDKEFGFPLSLMIREHTCNTETEPMETNCGIPVDIVKELEVEKVPQMAPALDVEDVVENMVSILPTKCSQSMVPDDSLTVDLKDPLDLLEIRVLPPDEARTIFEKFAKNEPPVLEFKSNEMISTTEEMTSLEEYCCIIRWKEVYSGMELVDGKCCCTSLESNTPGVILTDALLDPSEEGDIIDASLNPMQSNSSDISKIIDLAEELEVQQKVDCHLPITHPSTGVDLTEEEIINYILITVNGESISTSALEEGCIKVDLISACQAETLNIEPKQAQDHDDNATAQSNGNHITEARDDHSPAPEAVLNIEHKLSNCDRHELKSSGVMSRDDFSSNLKKRPRVSSELKRPKVKKMRRGGDSVPSVSQPALGDTLNNIIKEKVDVDDSTTAAKKTVKFALFGSMSQMKELCGKSPTSCPYFSGLLHQAPSVLTLTRSPVKSRLCEEWEKSYLPITRKKHKNKTMKDVNGNSASATAAHGGRKSTAKDLPLETSKMSKNHMTKKVHRKSKSKSKKDPDVPLKKNCVLGVLRNTFNLKDGHRNDKRYSVGGKLQRFEDYFKKLKR